MQLWSAPNLQHSSRCSVASPQRSICTTCPTRHSKLQHALACAFTAVQTCLNLMVLSHCHSPNAWHGPTSGSPILSSVSKSSPCQMVLIHSTGSARTAHTCLAKITSTRSLHSPNNTARTFTYMPQRPLAKCHSYQNDTMVARQSRFLPTPICSQMRCSLTVCI